MKAPFPSLALALAAFASPSPVAGGSAFLALPFAPKANPEIGEHARAQESALLKIRLDIAEEVRWKKQKQELSGQRMGIDGLTVELRGGEEAKYKHPNLPGANGPNPQLSSGPRALDLVRTGQFVDMTGTRAAHLENGAWEIVWKNDARSGSLICGFDVPEAIKRNAATIPKGRMYMTFPLFTDDTLRHFRERKAEAEEKAMELLDAIKDTTARFAEASSPLEKAKLLGENQKAHEALSESGYLSYERMPLERDMVRLAGGLHLCSLGTVWTKTEGWFGDHVLLGNAVASLGESMA